MLLKILMAAYIALVVIDSALTYIGIKFFGLAETWQSKVLFEYYGLMLGLLISTALCFCFGWLAWKLRAFKVATYIAISALGLTELVAVVNNAMLIKG